MHAWQRQQIGLCWAAERPSRDTCSERLSDNFCRSGTPSPQAHQVYFHRPSTPSLPPPSPIIHSSSSSLHITFTMASALRYGSSALRSSFAAPALNARTIAFNGLRCYSSAKSQVRRRPPPSDSHLPREAPSNLDPLQTLKERFAEQLPEKIEQIKKLRK